MESGQSGMESGWSGTEWDGMGQSGMEWDGVGWSGMEGIGIVGVVNSWGRG